MNLIETLITIITGVIAVLTINCSNTDVALGTPQNNQTGTIVKKTYIYSDKTFEIYYCINNGTINKITGSDDDAVAELMKDSTSGLIVDPREMDVFWIYPNKSECANVLNVIKKKYGSRKELYKANTITIDTGLALLYKHADYVDEHPLLTFRSATYVGDEFNDQISSLYIENAYIILYEHINFGGHSIAFASQLYSYSRFSNLTYYNMYGTNVNWNDQVSSYELHSYLER